MDIEARRKLVTRLIEYDGNPEQITEELRAFGWDCDEELVNIKSAHLSNVLGLYVSSKISTNDICSWANFVECREDIGFEKNNEGIIKEAIFWLANPDINRPITVELVQKIKDKLRNKNN